MCGCKYVYHAHTHTHTHTQTHTHIHTELINGNLRPTKSHQNQLTKEIWERIGQSCLFFWLHGKITWQQRDSQTSHQLPKCTYIKLLSCYRYVQLFKSTNQFKSITLQSLKEPYHTIKTKLKMSLTVFSHPAVTSTSLRCCHNQATEHTLGCCFYIQLQVNPALQWRLTNKHWNTSGAPEVNHLTKPNDLDILHRCGLKF